MASVKRHLFVVEVGDMDDYEFVPEELVDHIDNWDSAAVVVAHYPVPIIDATSSGEGEQ
jgi:hypothetical protein